MTNYICEGEVIEYVASGNVASGDVITSGNFIGIATTSGVSGDVIAVRVIGVYLLAKVTGTAWLQGDPLYWDNSVHKATKVATNNSFIGYAYQAAASGDATGYLSLKEVSGGGGAQAANVAAISAANGSDAGTTQTLANATKVTVNAILTALQNAGLMAAS